MLMQAPLLYRLVDNLNNLAAQLKLVQDAARTTKDAVDNINGLSGGAAVTEPDSAQEVREACGLFSYTLGLDLGWETQEDFILERAKFQELMQIATDEFLEQLDSLWDLLPAIQSIDKEAERVSTQIIKDRAAVPSCNAALTLEDIEAEKFTAETYFRSGTVARWWRWISTPSLQEQAAYCFESAKVDSFTNSSANNDFVTLLQELRQEGQIEDFVNRQVLLAASQLDHRIQEFYLVRYLHASSRYLTDGKIQHYARRLGIDFDSLPMRARYLTSEERPSHKVGTVQARRIIFDRWIPARYEKTMDRFKKSILDLQVTRHLASQLRSRSDIEQVIAGLADSKGEFERELFVYKESENYINLEIVNLEDLRTNYFGLNDLMKTK